MRRFGCFIALASLLFIGREWTNATPQNYEVLTIDATQPIAPPAAGRLNMGGKSPSGHELGINSQYLTLDGTPWLPVMGEFHFSRYPEQNWEDELRKMRAGGIQIVSTYVFWIHHEEVKGQFDWSGRRNLRRFIQLCKVNGLYAFVRIGPWAHGECRNGGFPDWLIRECPRLRRNDPCYLANVTRYFGEIGKQLQGLFWKDGGPIVGVNLEDDAYAEQGEGAGAVHTAELKRLALEAGTDAPIFTVEGWGGLDFPPYEFIPVFGGYPDAFWDNSLGILPPSVNYFFGKIRDDGAVGTDLRPTHPSIPHLEGYPFLTSELGGGMETSYHRRPLITADDVAALAQVKLGEGVNLLGYYMYHGGMNPKGKLSTLQESQATGYSNDLPVISYDFQAPLGEFGQVRPSYGALKVVHLFLHDFGSGLATMPPFLPTLTPASIEDRKTPRIVARAKDDQAFLFLNNYEHDYPMPAHQGFQVALNLPSGIVTLPRKKIAIPAGAYFIWPVNLNLDGIILKYATAQLLCKVTTPDAENYFFAAWPGIEPQFAVDTQNATGVMTATGVKSTESGITYVTAISPGPNVALELRSRHGRTVKIVVLTREQAERCYKFTLAGREYVVLSPADVFAEQEVLYFRSRVSQVQFSVFPPLDQTPKASVPLRTEGYDGIFMKYSAAAASKAMAVQVHQLRSPGVLGPVKMGHNVPLAPTGADFDKAAEWRIEVPKVALEGLSNLYLRIQYVGDIGRLSSGGELLDDNFYNGVAWEIGLKSFGEAALSQGLNLKIYPLRKGARIYLPKDAWPVFPASGEIAEIRSVSLVPEYELVVKVGAMQARLGYR